MIAAAGQVVRFLGAALGVLVLLNVAVFLLCSIVVFVLGFLRALAEPKKKPKKPEPIRSTPPYETTREAPAPPPQRPERTEAEELEIDRRIQDQLAQPRGRSFLETAGIYEVLEDGDNQERALRELLHDVGGR